MSNPSKSDDTRSQALEMGAPGASGSLHGEAAVSARMPTVFLPHGGGPWPFVDLGLERAEVDALLEYLQGVARLPQQTPRGLLIISAHWEEQRPTVMTAAHPPMLYDYYGFPESAYSIMWPAPGSPALAARVTELLQNAQIACGSDSTRGYDHGTFVPLKLAYPDAAIPTVQLSLKQGLDPSDHLAIGRALSPLRDEGIFIIGSGMTYHNLRAFFGPGHNPIAKQFDDWLVDAVIRSPQERDRQLVQWATAPAARLAHPREEHLLPLMVIAGAAGDDVARIAFRGTMMGKALSAFHFG